MLNEIVFGINKPDIYSNIAENAAKYILSNSNKNNSTQIRKFYDEIVKWNNKIQSRRSDNDKKLEFELSLPEIQKLRSQAAYAFSRDLIDDKYLSLFNLLIENIISPNRLREVKFFMEAMMGYYKYHEKLKEIEKENQRKQKNAYHNKQNFRSNR